MTKQQKVFFLSWIILGGLVLSLLYHFILSYYFHFGYPYATFLFRPQDRWRDFLWPLRVSANPYVVARADFQNFPFLYKLASIFSFLTPQAALGLYLGICFLAFSIICYKEFRTGKWSFPVNFAILAFLTYPFLFAFDRANFEIVVFLCLYLFILFYESRPAVSAVFLGFAIALKAFPVILAILYLTDRKYRDLVIAAVISLSATLISYATLPGGISVNLPLHSRNLQLYTQTYALGNEGLYFGNSLWGALKFTSVITGSQPVSTAAYLIAVGFGLIALFLYLVFLEKSFWKKVALLVCALNLFPQVSGDYKLLHLFLPIFLLVNDNEPDGKRMQFTWLILFGLLLIPKDYYHLPALPEASISVLLDPLLMLTLMLLIISMGLTRFLQARSGRNLAVS